MLGHALRIRHFRWTLAATIVLLLLVGPVIIEQILPEHDRTFTSVALDETTFTEISFSNTRQQLQLAGLLFVPAGTGPFPAAVIVHGSGTSNRRNGWYLTLTKYLQQSGIVVLLPDKRGSEKSEGDWRTADFHDLATDTLAAIDYLKGQEIVGVSGIGVIGMSQGGWIAPIVANEAKDLDFMVSIVGSAVSPNEQLLYEENYNLQQMGFLPGVSNVIAVLSTAWIKNIGQREFWDGIGDHDPVEYWRDLDVDALALFGREDTNVPTEASVARLQSLDNPRITIRIFDGSGHPLEEPENVGNSIFRQDALEAVRDFIRR